MTTLLKKYSKLMIASIVATNLLTALVLFFFPDLLTTHTSKGVIQSYGTGFLKYGIEYIINIIFVFLLYREMKTLRIMSIPLLIITFFSSLSGVIFLFIINAYDNLTTKQLIK